MFPARFYKYLPDEERIHCLLCPRYCKLKEGQTGYCLLRKRQGQKMVSSGYETVSGIAIDPIEKKPLYHFLPGSQVLSIGSHGCNLGCEFCQNSHISRNPNPPPVELKIESLVQLARKYQTPSVAFTYNEPTIWAEFVIDAAQALWDKKIMSVFISAGYIAPEARSELLKPMHAINFDLKAFSADFYRRYCKIDIQPVLDTISFVRNHTKAWLEITHLVIPGLNDSDEEYIKMLDWLAKNTGKETVLHLSAFHPSHKLTNIPRTPANTLLRKYEQAKEAGFPWVYIGNMNVEKEQSTFCNKCQSLLLNRTSIYESKSKASDFSGSCPNCGQQIPGIYHVPS
jgi:pyruvate formate lyase activating enzyme